MPVRLEHILERLAQQHAPHLVPAGWNLTGDPFIRLQNLARELTRHRLLVLLGDLDAGITTPDIHIQDWVRTCAQFYVLLAQRLFNSQSWIRAYHADDRYPPVVVLEAGAVPVLEVMAGTVLPYLTVRQPQVIPGEIAPLMDYVLHELEAHDLPPAEYRLLHEQGQNILMRMLAATVHYVALTSFDKPFSTIIRRPNVPPPPQSVGLKTLADSPQTPTEQLFIAPIPLPEAPKRRTAPLPKLPGDKDGAGS